MLPLVSSSVRTVHVWPGCELVGGGAELLELITLTAGREGSVSVSTPDFELNYFTSQNTPFGILELDFKGIKALFF